MNSALLLDVGYDWSAPRWSCREIGERTARHWAADWHYLGNLPSASYNFGLFCPDLVCIVMAGWGSGNPVGLTRFGLSAWPGDWEITRIVAHPDAPKNTVSRSLRFAGEYIHDTYGLDWLYSYADTGQGHHGGIYQAVGAVYVGLTKGETTYLVDAIPVHPRSMVHRHGTRAIATLNDIYGDRLELARTSAKHIYILPIGDKGSAAAIREALSGYAQPYPKRRQPLENEGPTFQVGDEDAVMRSGGST